MSGASMDDLQQLLRTLMGEVATKTDLRRWSDGIETTAQNRELRILAKLGDIEQLVRGFAARLTILEMHEREPNGHDSEEARTGEHLAREAPAADFP